MIDAGQPSFDRSEENGFRLVEYLADEPLAEPFTRPVESFSRDYAAETPVSDELFQAYKSFYAYDRAPLDAREGPVDDTAEFWRLQKVSYNASYGGERISAYLFLPKRLFRNSGGNKHGPHRGTSQGRRGGSRWPGGTAHGSESPRPAF